MSMMGQLMKPKKTEITGVTYYVKPHSYLIVVVKIYELSVNDVSFLSDKLRKEINKVTCSIFFLGRTLGDQLEMPLGYILHMRLFHFAKLSVYFLVYES